MREPRTALLAGATGLVGSRLLECLLADPDYRRVIAVSRRPLAIRHPRLHVELPDFEALDAGAECLAADDVFCCLGTTMKQAGSRPAFARVDLDTAAALARVGRSQGAQRFLLISAIGADPAAAVFYSRVKGRAEEAVAAAGYPTLHVFRPSLILGRRDGSRPGERLAIALARFLTPALLGPLRAYRPIMAATLAAAMAAAAKLDLRGRHVHTFHDIERLAAMAVPPVADTEPATIGSETAPPVQETALSG